MSTIDKTSKIAIVGAGPAGLSTAWFLSKQGFHNVTVLEKLGRVGGLCKSLTIDGMSFDLGANYVTWAYQETLAIAKEVGASTYAEKPYTSIDVAPDRKTFTYRSLFDAVLNNPYTGAKVSLISFVLAAVRYLSIRSRLSDVIDIPDYLDRIHEHPELCVSFKDWLAGNRLLPLATLFEFPITIMGYGRLEEIAAPYALRYMSLRTFLPDGLRQTTDQLDRGIVAAPIHRRLPAAVGTRFLADQRPAECAHHPDHSIAGRDPDRDGVPRAATRQDRTRPDHR